jgi:hypothetical protein
MEKCNMSRKKPTIEDFINTLRPKTDKEWDEFEKVPESAKMSELTTLFNESQLTESERMMKKWGENKFLTILLILLKFLKPFIFLGTSYGVFFFWLLTIEEYFPNIGDITLFFLFLPLFLGTLGIIYWLYMEIYDWIEDSF